MACCIIAAFLFAQFMAMLRRWGMFWGLVPVPQGVVADTAFTRVAAFVRRPLVRAALAALLLVELGVAGSWLYVEHGTHIAEEADIAWSSLQGERIVYAGLCSGTGYNARARIVLSQRDPLSIS